MCRQQRRADSDWKGVCQGLRSPQHLGLILERESVSGLDLYRGDSLREQRLQPRHALLEELLRRSGPDRTHGGENSSAGLGDLLIGAPAQPLLILTRAGAGENQVRMTVDEAGCYPRTVQVMR